MKEPLSIRVNVRLVELLRRASDSTKDPYAPTQTQIVERGIILALRELERKKK